MRLNEIKQVTSGDFDLTEGVIPVHIDMTLGQVIADGKVTNNVQTFIMAGLISMFKEGGPYRWPRDLNPYEMATGSEVIEAVKSLSEDEASKLAQWLKLQLQNPATYETNRWVCPSPVDTVGWVKWALTKQD